MTLSELRSRAESEGVEIDDFPMREVKAVATPEGWIALNRRRLRGDHDEKVTLAHELGHIERGAFYNIHTPLETRDRCEYKACKRSYEILVPIDKLLSAMKHGNTQSWELAEYFDVTAEFMYKCLTFYDDIGAFDVVEGRPFIKEVFDEDK